MVKIGYVREVNTEGSVVGTYSYEELLFDIGLRTRLVFDIERGASRLYCCCHEGNDILVCLSKNGEISFEGQEHKQECVGSLSGLFEEVSNSATYGAVAAGSVPVPVSFRWQHVGGKKPVAILKYGTSPRIDERINLSDYVTLLNMTTLSYRGNQRRKPSMDNSVAVYMDMKTSFGVRPLFNDENVGEENIRIDENMLYRRMEFGDKCLFYGKVHEWPDNFDKPYSFLKCETPRGWTVGIRVSSASLRKCRDMVPVSESVYICGMMYMAKLRIAEIPAGTPISKIKVNTRSRASEIPIDEKLIRIMSDFCAFSVNRAGMIVFSREEYDISNLALENGKRIYREIYGSGGFGKGRMMEYRENEEDVPL